MISAILHAVDIVLGSPERNRFIVSDLKDAAWMWEASV